MLSASGYKAVPASVGLDGISKFKKGREKFGLVMIDISLPGTSGLAVAKKIKQMSRETPIILIKARDRELSTEELNDSGVDFLLSKPFYMDRTLNLVRNAMGIEAG